MEKQEVNIHDINWPKTCAYCNGVAESSVKSKSAAVKKAGYYVFFISTTSRVIEIEYPVCKRHKIKAAIAARLSQRSMLSLALGVFSILFMFMAGAHFMRMVTGSSQLEYDLNWLVFSYVYPVLYWGGFFWAKKNTPIKIEDVKDTISFNFKNRDFAKEFYALNNHS